MSYREGKFIQNKAKLKDMGPFGVTICRVGRMYGPESIYGLVYIPRGYRFGDKRNKLTLKIVSK